MMSPAYFSRNTRSLAAVAIILLTAPAPAAQADTLPLVPKWSRFERSFVASRASSSPFTPTTLTVTFVSPLGETSVVHGFWDGGSSWRVRFSPSQAGRWTYSTACSDSADSGLDRQAGAFRCTAPAGTNRFQQHGRIRVARDHRHFEHADGTPFFWLADSTWDGAMLPDAGDWKAYAQARAIQQFSAIQWSAGRADSAGTLSPGSKRKPLFDIDQLRRFDATVDALNQAGLLSVILPFLNTDSLASSADDAEWIFFLRQMAARWAANDVAWIWRVDARDAAQAERLRRIGRGAFGKGSRAPVILAVTGDTPHPLRNEVWVDAVGLLGGPMAGAGWKPVSGRPAEEWTNSPARLFLNLEPAREMPARPGSGQNNAGAVRRDIWRSLLLGSSAGTGYSAEGVATRPSRRITPEAGAASNTDPSDCCEGLLFPGAAQMRMVADLFNSVEFWRLRPAGNILAEQSGMPNPGRTIAAAGTEQKDLELVYLSEERMVSLRCDALPALPQALWFNPRTGGHEPAVGVIEGRNCRFATPGPGDWLLMIRSGL